MYVGSKDYVLSLDLHDINREPLIVRASQVWGWRGAGCGARGLEALSSKPPPLTPVSGRSTGQPPHSALRSVCSQARMAM